MRQQLGEAISTILPRKHVITETNGLCHCQLQGRSNWTTPDLHLSERKLHQSSSKTPPPLASLNFLLSAVPHSSISRFQMRLHPAVQAAAISTIEESRGLAGIAQSRYSLPISVGDSPAPLRALNLGPGVALA